jgi:hypothetical protein
VSLGLRLGISISTSQKQKTKIKKIKKKWMQKLLAEFFSAFFLFLGKIVVRKDCSTPLRCIDSQKNS